LEWPDLACYLLWVALGSAAGGVARVALSALIARAVGETFPWGTISVNATGALAIGSLAAVVDAGLLGGWSSLWPLLAVGFLGSYTTVSSFSLQTLSLLHQRELLRAGGNVLLTLALCLGGVASGYLAMGLALGVPLA
jgi:CrcB protein